MDRSRVSGSPHAPCMTRSRVSGSPRAPCMTRSRDSGSPRAPCTDSPPHADRKARRCSSPSGQCKQAGCPVSYQAGMFRQAVSQTTFSKKRSNRKRRRCGRTGGCRKPSTKARPCSSASPRASDKSSFRQGAQQLRAKRAEERRHCLRLSYGSCRRQCSGG